MKTDRIDDILKRYFQPDAEPGDLAKQVLAAARASARESGRLLDRISIQATAGGVSLIRAERLEKPATAAAINDAFRAAATGALRGILDATDEQLVSVDFNGNPHSSIVDLPSTAVIDGTMVKVLAWYDNEWGYSNRVKDLIRYMSKSL